MAKRYALSILTGLWVSVLTASMTHAQEGASVEELKRVIEQQQEQLQKQQEVLESLMRQVEALQKTTAAAENIARGAETTATAALEAATTPDANNLEDQPIVTSGSERVKLAISGQVNRMVNVADDGETTKVFHVDNDNSSTRIRFVGTGQVSEDLTIGTNIEFEIESNSSSVVNQEDESSGTADFKDRVLEVAFDSRRLGELKIGQGSTASDGTAEVDLSGATVIAYSAVADTAGGLFFRDKDGDLTNVRVRDVFSNFDGLGRQDRVRYDSPSFRGARLSASVAEDDQWDIAGRWGGQAAGLRAGGALGVSGPARSSTKYRIDGSASVWHLGTGFNLTASFGRDENRDDRDDATGYYVKGGWRGDLFELGETAIVADFAWNQDVNANGDKAKSFGLYAVQHMEEFGTELYAGVRNYDLDSEAVDTDAIWVGSAGSRIKF
ncbi:MAG: hypothetical protein ACE5Q3_14850 [Alphaproteobacteria bacterium]